jgi:hypothetical protein
MENNLSCYHIVPESLNVHHDHFEEQRFSEAMH